MIYVPLNATLRLKLQFLHCTSWPVSYFVSVRHQSFVCFIGYLCDGSIHSVRWKIFLFKSLFFIVVNNHLITSVHWNHILRRGFDLLIWEGDFNYSDSLCYYLIIISYYLTMKQQNIEFHTIDTSILLRTEEKKCLPISLFIWFPTFLGQNEQLTFFFLFI